MGISHIPIFFELKKELLRQNETAVPIILIEVTETISSLMKMVDLEVAAVVAPILTKLSKLFSTCVNFDILAEWMSKNAQNVGGERYSGTDELTKYVFTKIRSILEWISNCLLNYGQRKR